MRERGSNAARPTKKGGGGLPIGSRLVAIGRADAPDWVAIGRNRSGRCSRLGRDWVAIGSRLGRDWSRLGRDWSTSSIGSRLGRDWSQSVGAKTRHKKARLPQLRESGLLLLLCVAVLSLLLIPHANKRSIARSVLQGLGRRSCIVMITSRLRHIVRYI